MKVLSLFDGISCGMVALERAGVPVEKYVAYEIEENAIKISKKNYPQIEHCGDVTKADFTQYKGYDLLLAGFPCQSVSITTGKHRTHLKGKSGLFWELVRALEQAKPKYFLIENVASMNAETAALITDVLGVQPIYFDSSLVCAQTRPRVYWTNIPIDEKPRKASDLVLKDILEPSVDEKYFYNCSFDFHGLDKTVCATLHINGHDILKRVNSPLAKCQTLTAVCGGNQQKKVYIDGRCRKLTPIEYERLQTLPDNYTAGVADGARYKAIGNGWTVDVIAHIFRGLQPEKVITWYERIRSMSIDEMASFLTYLKTRGVLETADRYICQKCKEEHGGRCSIGDDDKCLYDMGDKDTIKLWLEGDGYKYCEEGLKNVDNKKRA